MDRNQAAAAKVFTLIKNEISTFRGFFSEQLDDLGGRTLRSVFSKEMLKEMFFFHESNQLQPDPIHVHNSGRAQRGVGVQDHGDSGREFELQAKLL